MHNICIYQERFRIHVCNKHTVQRILYLYMTKYLFVELKHYTAISIIFIMQFNDDLKQNKKRQTRGKDNNKPTVH